MPAETRTARFGFYGDLVGLLRLEQRDKPFDLAFRGRQSARHLVESLSVPHTEVGHMMIDGQPSSLGAIVSDGQRVEVFPCSPPPRPEPEACFILDNHLGRLAASLRMLGFDCLYRNDYQDEELAAVASAENRILLTRDRRLLMRSLVQRGRLLRSKEPPEQLGEIVRRYTLASAIRPFLRCMRCNAVLEPVEKAAILEQLQPLTVAHFDDFRRCPACRQVYWKGSHYERMLKVIHGI